MGRVGTTYFGPYFQTPVPDFKMYCNDDVIKWQHFPRFWSFVRGIHRSPVNSPHKGQWLHPTNRDHFTACPSVRPVGRPSVRPSGEVSGHLPENARRKWPEILHADVSWPSSEMINLWPQSVDFFNFGTILTQWNGSNLGFPGISRGTHGGNGLKFCMLMYLDHLENWLVYGHSLLIFLILALFCLSETGQIWGFRAFPGEHMEGMPWNMVCCCILTTFRTD